MSFFSDLWTDESLKNYEAWLDARSPSTEEPLLPPPVAGPDHEIGTLTYGAGQVARLTVPPTVNVQFNVNIQGQHAQKGLHIPSHGAIYTYQPVQSIPTMPRGRDQVSQAYANLVRNRYYGQYQQQGPNYYLKETLIALAAFGCGNEVIEKNSENLATFQGLKVFFGRPAFIVRL